MLRLTGVPNKVNNVEPVFKPKNSGHFPGLPLEALWRHAPPMLAKPWLKKNAAESKVAIFGGERISGVRTRLQT